MRDNQTHKVQTRGVIQEKKKKEGREYKNQHKTNTDNIYVIFKRMRK